MDGPLVPQFVHTISPSLLPIPLFLLLVLLLFILLLLKLLLHILLLITLLFLLVCLLPLPSVLDRCTSTASLTKKYTPFPSARHAAILTPPQKRFNTLIAQLKQIVPNTPTSQ